jgi:hypothetical protein
MQSIELLFFACNRTYHSRQKRNVIFVVCSSSCAAGLDMIAVCG